MTLVLNWIWKYENIINIKIDNIINIVPFQVIGYRADRRIRHHPPAEVSRLRRNRNSGQRRRPAISQRTFLQKTRNRISKRNCPSGVHRRRPRQKRRQKEFQNFGFQIPIWRSILGGSNRCRSFNGFYFPSFWAATRFGSRASVSGCQLGLGPGAALLWLFDHPDIRFLIKIIYFLNQSELFISSLWLN